MATSESTLPTHPAAVWWMAARPKTLVAAFVPVLVGTALAWDAGSANLLAAAAALFGAFMIQVGTNLTNDLYDFKRGADDEERLGPTRVTQAGLLSQGQVMAGIVISFGLSFACGLYLTWLVGWPLLVVGILCIISGIAYTAGPFPLAYLGLGDLFVFVFFGVVATVGAYWVQVGQIDVAPLVASAPVGLLATALIAVNNLRDIQGDARVDKKTMAVRLGRRWTVRYYRALVLSSYLVPVAMWLLMGFDAWILLPLASAPLSLGVLRDVDALEGVALNGVLARTARLQLVFGVLLAVGVAL